MWVSSDGSRISGEATRWWNELFAGAVTGRDRLRGTAIPWVADALRASGPEG